VEASDTGSAPPSGASCGDYCDFANACISANALASAALPDVVSGLHAADKSACTSSCADDLGADGSSDSVVACVQAGRADAACDHVSTQAGLAGAIGLINQDRAERDPKCRLEISRGSVCLVHTERSWHEQGLARR
jgi:hypothetical protein